MTIERFKNSLRLKREIGKENDIADDPELDLDYFSDIVFIQGLIFGSLPVALSLVVITYAYRNDRSKTSKNNTLKYALIFVLFLIVAVPFIMKHSHDKLLAFINN